jgi:organic radical activating enzyme
MYHIPNKVDFYITNVCNLTCQDCNRFNNVNFKGWQAWAEYGPIYEEWAKLVSLSSITIMGGEPFLNPTLNDWVAGLNRLFGIEVQILTNGTRFPKADGLYETMLAFRGKSRNNAASNHIGVSLHIPEEFEQLRSDIHDFCQGTVTEYIGDQAWAGAEYTFKDTNGIMVNVYTVDHFSDSSLVIRPDGTYTLRNSDPIKAHEKCPFVLWKSRHFIRGKFYKCGPSALMPEFDDQFHLDITDSDREMLHSYKALTVDNFVEYHEEFFGNLDNVIPQCKFCPGPELQGMKKIYPIRKGKSSN